MKHLKTFESYITSVNEGSIQYVDADHKEFVEEEGLEKYPTPLNLKDLVNKKVRVIKPIKYDDGEMVDHGTEGTIRHAYIVDGEVVYSILSDDNENFEAEPNEIKIIA